MQIDLDALERYARAGYPLIGHPALALIAKVRELEQQRDTARGVAERWTVERRENGDILIQSPTGDRAGVWHDDTSPLAEVVRQLFQDMMYAAPTPPDGGIPTDTIDRLTRQKATHIIARDGFQVSGVVLTKPNGSVCIVDKSAVRWLTGDELFRVMHPDAPPDGDAGRDRLDAERYRFIRATTKAVRDDNGGGRVEVTPEEFDAMTDDAMTASKGEGGA